MGTKLEELTALTPSSDWQDEVQARGPVKCVAVDHPSCQITCAGGECIAFYHEPSGPCVSQCLAGAVQPIRMSNAFSLQLIARNGQPLIDLFGDELPEELVLALRGTKGPIEVRGRFTREKFVYWLWEHLRAMQSSSDPSGFA